MSSHWKRAAPTRSRKCAPLTDDVWARVVQQKLDPLHRLIHSDRQKRPTRLQHAEHRRNHLRRTVERHGHQHLRADAARAQRRRHRIRALVQIGVAQRLLFENHRRRVWCTRSLPFKQFVQAAIVPISNMAACSTAGSPCAVPLVPSAARPEPAAQHPPPSPSVKSRDAPAWPPNPIRLTGRGRSSAAIRVERPGAAISASG